jgi:T4-like virus Myoviridae tail sheath stabiliser
MLDGKVFYHGTIRKAIVAFGTLFSNIYIERRQGDSVNGTMVQKIQVPLAYAPKEKWIVRLDSDPTLDHHTYTTLPRISFEITGYNYDPSRKVGRMNQIRMTGTDSAGTAVQKQVFSPSPYNLDISLYILTKTQEDALQILEQILPNFTPEYNLTTNAIPELRVIQDVPIVLNNVSVQDDYDGDFQTRRFVTHTLSFTMKVNLFNEVNNAADIRTVTANVNNTTPATALYEQTTPSCDSNGEELVVTDSTIASYTATVDPICAIPDETPVNVNENWTETL